MHLQHAVTAGALSARGRPCLGRLGCRPSESPKDIQAHRLASGALNTYSTLRHSLSGHLLQARTGQRPNGTRANANASGTADTARDAWLWQNKAFASDVTLLVYPAGGGPDALKPGDKPEPVARLSLHSTVLASASPEHYRPQLLKLLQEEAVAPVALPSSLIEPLWELPADDHAKFGPSKWQLISAHWQRVPVGATSEGEGGAPGADGILLELTLNPGESATVPEAVFCHAYTGMLPDEAHLLAWIMWQAEQLGIPATVEASLAKLRAMADGGKLTVQDLVVISNLPAFSQTGTRAPVEQQVALMAAKVLPAQLRDASKLLADKQLLGQFVQLPFYLLKQWAMLESVVVDSENTVAVLITAWYDHQLSGAPSTTAPTDEQCEELSALICLDKVSPSFHLQALPHLTWYHAPEGLPEQHSFVRVLQLINKDANDYETKMASGGVSRRLDPPKTFTWPISYQELQQLWTEPRVGHVNLSGLKVKVCLEVEEDTANGSPPVQRYMLALKFKVEWPAELIAHGVDDHVPNPVASMHVAYEVGPTHKGEATYMLCQDEWSNWFDVLQEQRFSSFEEMAVMLGMSSQPDQATKLPLKITLSNIQ